MTTKTHDFAWQLPVGTKLLCDTSDDSTYVTTGKLDGCYVNATSEKGARALVYFGESVEKITETEYRLVPSKGRAKP